MLTASQRRDVADALYDVSEDTMRNWLYANMTEETSTDDLMGVEVNGVTVDDSLTIYGDDASKIAQLLHKAWDRLIDEVKGDIKDAQAYRDQVRRDYARAVGF